MIVDCITLEVHSQACQKYPKWEVCNIVETSQGKSEGWIDFLPADWYYHFRCVWPGIPKLLKITSLLFLFNILRKSCVMKLIFCMQISMKISYNSMQRFLMRMVKYSQSSQNSKFAMSLQYLEMKLELDAR